MHVLARLSLAFAKTCQVETLSDERPALVCGVTYASSPGMNTTSTLGR